MPYGVPDDLWRRLPADEQAAIAATASMPTPTPAPTIPPPAPALTPPASTPAPPPTPPTPDPYATDALVPPGVRVPSGYLGKNVTLITAPSSTQPPPTGVQNPAQPTAATPAAPTGAEPNASQPTRASVGPNPANPSQRVLLGIPPPEEGPIGPEPFPEWLKGFKDALAATHYGEAPDNVSKAFRNWVERNWLGSPFTPAQLGEAFSLAETETVSPFGMTSAAEGFKRANPPGTHNPFEFVAFSPYAASNLLRRAFAIQKDLDRTASQDAHLEGALSAVGLVLAIVDRGAASHIPYAGRYVGVGDPATSLQASLEDVLKSAGEATVPRG